MASQLIVNFLCITAASVFYVITKYFLGAPLDSAVIQRWSVAAWSLDLVVNALGTLAIAGRLWWVGRQTAGLKPDGRNTYLSVAFIILESGAMFSIATFILVIMFVNPPTTQGATAGIYVVTQLAVRSLTNHLGVNSDKNDTSS